MQKVSIIVLYYLVLKWADYLAIAGVPICIQLRTWVD